MKIGILCPSEIAIRRFMPALVKSDYFEFSGIGVNSIEERFGKNIPANANDVIWNGVCKAIAFKEQYGGRLFSSYEEIVTAPDVDAIYIPSPPALHYRWAKAALENGKHVMVEKPATTVKVETESLVATARKKNLVLHENYMFIFHRQLDAIDEIVKSGEIGDIRLYRISFGFPMRTKNDFRYNKELGGGALIDAGGYTIRYATRLLGDTIKLDTAKLNYLPDFEVDMFGSATLSNDKGMTVQVAFGMDNDYKCELEVWGSKGTLTTGRVLTAPAGFTPELRIKKNIDMETRSLPADDAFLNSIEHFKCCIEDNDIRESTYKSILKQAKLVEQFAAMINN